MTGNAHPAAFPLSFVYLFSAFFRIPTSQFPLVLRKTNPKALGISLVHVSNPHAVEEWRVWGSLSSTSDKSELTGRQRSISFFSKVTRDMHWSPECRSANWIDLPCWSSHYTSLAPADMIPAIIVEQLFHQKCIRCFTERQTARSQWAFRPNFIS